MLSWQHLSSQCYFVTLCPCPSPLLSVSSPTILQAETLSYTTSASSQPRPGSGLCAYFTKEMNKEFLPHLEPVKLLKWQEFILMIKSEFWDCPNHWKCHYSNCTGHTHLYLGGCKPPQPQGKLKNLSHPGGLSPEFLRYSMSLYCPLTIQMRSTQRVRSYKMPGTALDILLSIHLILPTIGVGIICIWKMSDSYTKFSNLPKLLNDESGIWNQIILAQNSCSFMEQKRKKQLFPTPVLK